MTTKRQQQVLDFIREREAAGEVSPSYAEIARHCGIVSVGWVHRLVAGLLKHGYLIGDYDASGMLRARSLRLSPAPPQLPPADHLARYIEGLREVSAIEDAGWRRMRAAEIIALLRAAQ